MQHNQLDNLQSSRHSLSLLHSVRRERRKGGKAITLDHVGATWNLKLGGGAGWLQKRWEWLASCKLVLWSEGKISSAMADLEDSLSTALDYESEVAYIALTSPAARDQSQGSEEFDFSFPQEPAVSIVVSEEGKEGWGEEEGKGAERKEEEAGGKEEVVKMASRPPLLSKTSSARPAENHPQAKINTSPFLDRKPPTSPTKKSSVSPLTLEVSRYTLDTDMPSTPTSKLRRIKEAQASSKAHPKLEQSDHLYCIVVVYGSSGCGRTHLVDKLVYSNPSLFAKVVSSTTRRRRANEVSGVDFHYTSHREMSQGIARGDYLESIRVYRRKERKDLRKRAITQASADNSPVTSPAHVHIPTSPVNEDTATPPSPVNTSPDTSTTASPATPPTRDRKYGSLFDLTAEDSPSVGGEMFGTTYQSLTTAIQQQKPCVLLNVSTRGAQQLKTAQLNASFVLICSEGSRNATRIERDNSDLEPDLKITLKTQDQAYSELHQYALQLVGALGLPDTSQFQVAEHEWAAMPTVEFEQANQRPHKRLVEVTFSELLAYFHSTNLKAQLQRAKNEHSKSSFSFTRLSKRLQSEKLLIHAISYCQLNDKERVHLRMLQTVYSKLTGNNLMCRRIGSHWQEVGFTGVDPADDLQTVGLLGLAQLICFLDNQRTARFCKEIFQYCHRDTHVVPFVVLALEFSQLALEALENGTLNKICNKRDQVFVPVNEFYMAAFYHYFQTWKSSQKSILQLGLLMKQCGDYCKTHPRQVMEQFDKCLSIREPQNQLLPALVPQVETSFTPFEQITTT